MGSNHSVQSNKVALDIWRWCMARNIWISAEHIAGKCNVAADRQSREINTNTEWMLNPTLLNKALVKLQARPDVEMFASRLNKQFPRYISFRPDTGAYLVDAFSAQWNELNGYYFPPFQCDSKGPSKTGTRQSHGDSGNPQMANSGVVLNGYENADKLPIPSAAQCQTTSVAQPPTESTSIAQETGPSHLPLIREQLHASGLSQAASDIILCAWRDGTKNRTERIFPSGKITATPKGSVQFQLL